MVESCTHHHNRLRLDIARDRRRAAGRAIKDTGLPLGPWGHRLLRTIDCSEGEFLHRINTAVTNDCDEWKSSVQEIVCGIQGFLSFDGLYYTRRFTWLPCTMNTPVLLSVDTSRVATGLGALPSPRIIFRVLQRN